MAGKHSKKVQQKLNEQASVVRGRELIGAEIALDPAVVPVSGRISQFLSDIESAEGALAYHEIHVLVMKCAHDVVELVRKGK